jgi:hypothetical protein
MENKSRLIKIVMYQNLGFLAIIALCFLDELLQLPSLIFSDHPFDIVYRRSMLEMLLFLAVWLLVSGSTNRLLKHVRHLEAFMRVCAWCRRIDCKGEWMELEAFMEQGFDTPTTHGICTECLQQQKEAIAQAKRLRESAPPA